MPQNRVDRRHLSSRSLLLGLTLALGLAGCAVSPVQEEARLLAPLAGEPLRQADALVAQGKAGEAAQAYLKIAEGVGSPAREQLQLKAARAYLTAADTGQAQQTVAAIARPKLTAAQREQLLLLEADLALLDGRPRDAITRLQAMQAALLPNELKIQRLGSLAAAQRLAREPVAAAESLIALDRLLDDDEARLLNQLSLITTLSALDDTQLDRLARTGSGDIRGWAEVARIAREAGADPARFENRYRQIQGRTVGARAHPQLARAYVRMLSGGYAPGNSLVVMLPRDGRFASAATAIREGIEAARAADASDHRPRIELVDSTRTERARTLHREAVEGGASHVIGPLEKEAVDQLAAGPALAVPTLALNQTSQDTQAAANLFQFSLSPENEAAEAANKAAAMGLKRALVLYPEGAWGERLASAFRDQWRRLGGTISGQSIYNPTARSQDRTVAALVGDTDAQVLFLAATSELAQRIYPLIRQSAPALTVIATSHVYSGAFDTRRDPALAGLYFVDIPWMLEDADAGPLSRRRLSGGSFSVANPLARLHAMGIDAYRIAPRLSDLAKNPGAHYPGQTGGLSVDPLGRLHRQLALGRFDETGVRQADSTPDPAAR